MLILSKELLDRKRLETPGLNYYSQLPCSCEVLVKKNIKHCVTKEETDKITGQQRSAELQSNDEHNISTSVFDFSTGKNASSQPY